MRILHNGVCCTVASIMCMFCNVSTHTCTYIHVHLQNALIKWCSEKGCYSSKILKYIPIPDKLIQKAENMSVTSRPQTFHFKILCSAGGHFVKNKTCFSSKYQCYFMAQRKRSIFLSIIQKWNVNLGVTLEK